METLEKRELMAVSVIDFNPGVNIGNNNLSVPAVVGSVSPHSSGLQPVALAASTSTAPITAIDVIVGSSASISRSGWDKLNVDLNKGAGGKYIYIVYQRGSGTPITDLQIIVGKNAAAPAGFTKINVDLNAGAGGDYLYLCFRKSSTKVPINGLDVITGGNSSIQHPDPTFSRINIDLNKGCGSDTPFIYLNYRTKGSTVVSAAVRNALAGVAEGYLERQFANKSFDSSASDTHKFKVLGVPSSATVSTSVSLQLAPIERLDLNFSGMVVLRGPDRLIVDLSLSSPAKGSVSGKIHNIVSASTKFTATATVTARVEFAVSRSGTVITASPRVVSLSGSVSNVQFSNDVANTIRGYFTKHVNAAIEKDSQDFSNQLNNSLASAAASGMFSTDLKKLFS